MNQTAASRFAFEGTDTCEADLTKAETLLGVMSQVKIECAYGAPWSLRGALSEERLKAWFDFHLNVLVLRGRFPERVRLVRWTESLSKEESQLRGVLFERSFPEYWEMYESLEGVADLGKGSPKFRSNSLSLDRAGVIGLLNQAERVPELRQQAATLSQRCDELAVKLAKADSQLQEGQADFKRLREKAVQAETDAAQKLASAESRLQVLQGECDALRDKLSASEADAAQKLASAESRLQVLQGECDALRDKLSASEADAVTLKSRLEASLHSETELRQASDRAQVEQKQLRAQILEAEQQAQLLQTRLASTEKESALFLQQLHETQETLERRLTETKSLEGRAADSAKKVEAVQQDLQKIQSEKKTLQDKLKAAELKQKETEKKEKLANSEAELLLQQLHQVQEEMEVQFLEAASLKTETERTLQVLQTARLHLEKQVVANG